MTFKLPGLRDLANTQYGYVAELLLRKYECDFERAEANWKDIVYLYRQRNVEPMTLAMEKAAETWASLLQQEGQLRRCADEDRLLGRTHEEDN